MLIEKKFKAKRVKISLERLLDSRNGIKQVIVDADSKQKAKKCGVFEQEAALQQVTQ